MEFPGAGSQILPTQVHAATPSYAGMSFGVVFRVLGLMLNHLDNIFETCKKMGAVCSSLLLGMQAKLICSRGDCNDSTAGVARALQDLWVTALESGG